MMLAIPHRFAPPLAFCHMLTAKGKAAPTWRPPFQNADVKLPTDLPINAVLRMVPAQRPAPVEL